MDHDVFISYSSPDKTAAEAICAALESRNIYCWLAPRNLAIGKVWVEAIVDAIDASRIFILVLSSSSNNSPQVIREVEQAASKNILIIPIRIDNTPLSKAIGFFISRHQWLDAQTPPLEKHLPYLVDTVQQLLAQEAAAKAKQKADAAAKEKAQQKVEAALERAAQEAEEAWKVQEVATKAKKQAEAARERAKREAEKSAETIVEEKKLAPAEMLAPSLKKKTKLLWLWAGIVLSFIGLCIAWLFTILWSGIIYTEKPTEPWYILYIYTLMFGSPLVILGIYLLRRGIAGTLLTKPTDEKVSNWWWFLPIALGFIGGVVSWIKHKNVNWHKAMNMLTAGIMLTFIFTIPLLGGNAGFFPRDILSFSDDFEDGNADGWQLEPGWRVMRDNGNYVLEGQTQDYQRAWPRVTLAQNYVLEADFELVYGLFEFEVRSSGSGSQNVHYVVWVYQHKVDLGKSVGYNFLSLSGSMADIGLGRWHNIGIALDGSNIKVYIDRELKIDYRDGEPLLHAGSFRITSHLASKVHVDNIVVKPYPSSARTPGASPLQGEVAQ